MEDRQQGVFLAEEMIGAVQKRVLHTEHSSLRRRFDQTKAGSSPRTGHGDQTPANHAFSWFDNQAEEAARFYTSVFDNARILSTVHYTPAGAQASGREAGSVMIDAFQLDGQDFTALNGGPHFKFNEAISLVVNCESQQEIDH